MSAHPRVFPVGSTVLVVGAASFVGAHIVNTLLTFGYRVRAADYDASKSAWLTEETFKSYADTGVFDLVIVPDITAKNAFNGVMQGVSAVIYVTNVEVKFNPNETIPANVAGILNALGTAAKEPSILRFVYTSSYSAAFIPTADPNARLNSDSWNEAAVAQAWAPPPYDVSRYQQVYMASKVQNEQALWKFVKEESPHFTVNSVLPSYITGKVFSKGQNPSSTFCLRGLYDGDLSWLRKLGIYSYVSARDVALIHVAAAIDPKVASQRIYAIAEHTDWNDFLRVLRRLYPDRTFMEDLENAAKFQGQVDTSLGLGLVKKWGDRDGWISLEDGIKDTLDY